MKRAMVLVCAASILSGAVFAAQLYRWVDEKGNVEWRYTPPPASAKKIEQRRVNVGTTDTASLPYSVQQAVKNFPVTLWIYNCGAPCDQARAHLARRGVPYTEKDPQADVEAFKKLTGSAEIPVLYVGSTRLKGYLDSDWDAALDAAGYPRTAIATAGKPAPKPAAAPEPKPAAQPATKPGVTPPVSTQYAVQ